MVADPTYHMVGEAVLTSKGSVGPGFAVLRVLQTELGYQVWTDATPFALTAFKADFLLGAEVVVVRVDAVDRVANMSPHNDRLSLTVILPGDSQGQHSSIASLVQRP
jgi:hypothetical protein